VEAPSRAERVRVGIKCYLGPFQVSIPRACEGHIRLLYDEGLRGWAGAYGAKELSPTVAEMHDAEGLYIPGLPCPRNLVALLAHSCTLFVSNIHKTHFFDLPVSCRQVHETFKW